MPSDWTRYLKWFGDSNPKDPTARSTSDTIPAATSSLNVPPQQSEGTNGRSIDCMTTLQEYHQLARDCIERAAMYEERAGGVRGPEALSHYHQGMQVLREGLALPVLTSSSDAMRLRSQMMSWQVHVEALLAMSVPPQHGVVPAGGSAAVSVGRSPVASERPPLALRGPTSSSTSSSSARHRTSTKRPGPPPSHAPVPSTSGRDVGGGVEEGGALRAAVLSEAVDPCKLTSVVSWEDIAGLHLAKRTLQEMVVLPALRSDLFTGLRRPPRGVLLFGPPGTGKTMLAKAVASKAKCTFFSISASTLTSKWVGEGEKMVRALFEVATEKQPAVIFLDEMDSVLSKRLPGEHDASRRLKTEFLVRMDGLSSESNQVFVIGATNRPQELDEAVRRRLERRVYIPLPDPTTRATLLSHLLHSSQTSHRLGALEMQQVVKVTEGYSGSDLKALAREAAMEPLRELGSQLASIPEAQIRSVTVNDFLKAASSVKATVSKADLQAYKAWNKEYGVS